MSMLKSRVSRASRWPWCCCASAAAAAYAHHSFAAEFDSNKPIKMAGVVTRLEWTNPHVYLFIDVNGQGRSSHELGLRDGPAAHAAESGLEEEQPHASARRSRSKAGSRAMAAITRTPARSRARAPVKCWVPPPRAARRSPAGPRPPPLRRSRRARAPRRKPLPERAGRSHEHLIVRNRCRETGGHDRMGGGPVTGSDSARPSSSPALPKKQRAPRLARRMDASASPARRRKSATGKARPTPRIFFNYVKKGKTSHARREPAHESRQSTKCRSSPACATHIMSRESQAEDPHTRCKPSGGSRFWHTPYGIEDRRSAGDARSAVPARRRAAQLAHRVPRWARASEGSGAVLVRPHHRPLGRRHAGHGHAWASTSGSGSRAKACRTRASSTSPRSSRARTSTSCATRPRSTIRARTRPPWSGGWNLRWSEGNEPFDYLCQENNRDPQRMVGHTE